MVNGEHEVNSRCPAAEQWQMVDGRCSVLLADGRRTGSVVDGRCLGLAADGRRPELLADGRCSALVVESRHSAPLQ